MRALILVVIPLALGGESILAQPPADFAARLDGVARMVAGLGRSHGPAIWPGFRPDTIPLRFVLPERGSFLFHWPGTLPAGYQPVAGFPETGWQDARSLGAASTAGELEGRTVAQVVVGQAHPAELVATALHEAFHVLQGATRQEGRKFGKGENAFFVSSYPIFDESNEVLFALEGRLLAQALGARSGSRRRELAQQFVAVRRARLARLDPGFAEFDRASEMNEGLAEYALIRALDLLATDESVPTEWRDEARRGIQRHEQSLAELTANTTQSFRLRYYATGPAQGRLLDLLSPGWQARLLDRNQYLDQALGEASGLDQAERQAFARAMAGGDSATRRRDAAGRIAELQRLRKAQVDSVLAAPGILLELSAAALPSRDFGFCGFDPQNHLQVTPTIRLQTRWWRPCAGGGRILNSEFNVPSVHDAGAGTIRAVIGPEADVRLTIGGRPAELADSQEIADAADLRLEAPRASVQAAKARVSRHGRVLRITPLP